MTNKSIRDYINLIESAQAGVAEGSESDAYGNTGEKHECGSCDGTGIDTYNDECPECGGKGWVRDKEE
jgi:DnaJ-class molecular chaperone